MRTIPTFDFGSDGQAGHDGRTEPVLEPVRGAGTSVSLAIGEILMRDGVLDSDQVDRILALQEKDRLRFGEAALKLRLVKAKELERALSTQFEHPVVEADAGKLSRELSAVHRPGSSQVELLRQSRSLLMQHWFSAHPALAVVSSDHRDGRSYLCANLAVLFAHLGRPTLLIDADMRRPRQHELFRMQNRLGLSHVLAGRARPMQAVSRVPAISTLALMPAGPVPPNPLELLDRGSLPAVLKELARHYSVILIDTPAGNLHGDARAVAHACRGALVLLRCHRTRVRDAKVLAGRLVRAETKVVGTLLNRY